MKPLEFTLENAIEILPDDVRKMLGNEARKFANAGYPPRKLWKRATSLAELMLYEHKKIVWMDAYEKRKARLERMKNDSRNFDKFTKKTTS